MSVFGILSHPQYLGSRLIIKTNWCSTLRKACNSDTKVEKNDLVIFLALNIKQKIWNKRYALAVYTAIQCSVAEAKGSARKTVVLLNWVSEVERDLTPAHFHWVVVIARAAAARTAAPRPWRGRGLGDGSAVAPAAAGTSEAMPTLLEC